MYKNKRWTTFYSATKKKNCFVYNTVNWWLSLIKGYFHIFSLFFLLSFNSFSIENKRIESIFINSRIMNIGIITTELWLRPCWNNDWRSFYTQLIRWKGFFVAYKLFFLVVSESWWKTINANNVFPYLLLLLYLIQFNGTAMTYK